MNSEVQSAGQSTVRLTVAYLGTHYAGWQRQPNARTVQEALEQALEQLCGAAVVAVGAGRTDAGVHAEGQVVHLTPRAVAAGGQDRPAGQIPDHLSTRSWVLGTNRYLPIDVRVLDACRCGEGFHAQRDAQRKRYRYRLSGNAVVPPHEGQVRVLLPPSTDLDLFDQALGRFVGRHDFSAFQKTGGAPADPVRTVERCELERDARGRFDVVVEARGFLRGMVRAMVGTALEVARDRRDLASLERLLSGGSRSEAGPAAAARGLTLERVWYEDAGSDRFPLAELPAAAGRTSPTA